MAKRQTIWLSTMMVLCLMLIGYYTINDTIKPIPTDSTLINTNAKDTGSTKPKVQPESKPNGSKDMQGSVKDNTSATQAEASDFFIGKQMDLGKKYSQRMSELEAVIGSAGKSNEEIAQADKELKGMQEFEQIREDIEGKVEALGYAAAILTKESNGYVSITVQANKLTDIQAAKINAVVQQNMKVPAQQIVVGYNE